MPSPYLQASSSGMGTGDDDRSNLRKRNGGILLPSSHLVPVFVLLSFFLQARVLPSRNFVHHFLFLPLLSLFFLTIKPHSFTFSLSDAYFHFFFHFFSSIVPANRTLWYIFFLPNTYPLLYFHFSFLIRNSNFELITDFVLTIPPSQFNFTFISSSSLVILCFS